MGGKKRDLKRQFITGKPGRGASIELLYSRGDHVVFPREHP
jgi:hypothetical protein